MAPLVPRNTELTRALQQARQPGLKLKAFPWRGGRTSIFSDNRSEARKAKAKKAITLPTIRFREIPD